MHLAGQLYSRTPLSSVFVQQTSEEPNSWADALENASAARSEQEEVKELIESTFDLTAYIRQVPKGQKFERFTDVPKNIISEFILKDYEFYFEKDEKFKYKGQPTYKFAATEQ